MSILENAVCRPWCERCQWRARMQRLFVSGDCALMPINEPCGQRLLAALTDAPPSPQGDRHPQPNTTVGT